MPLVWILEEGLIQMALPLQTAFYFAQIISFSAPVLLRRLSRALCLLLRGIYCFEIVEVSDQL